MSDLIVYCGCADDFDRELSDSGLSVDELTAGIDRTPRAFSPDRREWVVLIRVMSGMTLPDIGCLEILGTKREVDASPEKTATYLRCHSREPYTVDDAVITPPMWHGEFS